MAKVLGTPLMPWQQHVADVIMEIDPATGLLFYREWGLLVPRQSGKTTLVLAKAVHRARAWERQRITYSAQTRNDARQKWEDEHLPILEASPYGKRKAFRPRKMNGSEAILWNNGSTHGLVAVTKKSGHGPTIDEAFIDEAFAQVDYRLEGAFKPAMITRPQPQLGVMSTAGETPDDSPYLWDKVVAGRERCELGHHGRVAYFEWSAAEDWPRDDPETWWRTMPALGITQPLSAIQAEFEAATTELAMAEWDRAFLCRWGTRSSKAVISAEQWDPLGGSTGMYDPVTLALDVSPDQSSAAIAAVGDSRNDPAKAAGALVDHRPGTGWCLERAQELDERHHPRSWEIDPSSPASAVGAEMEAAGLPVHWVSTGDATKNCQLLLDHVVNSRIEHEADPRLDAAVAGGGRRKIKDAWAWTRTGSDVDICPLVAFTNALGGHRRPVDDDEGEDFADVIG